MAENTVLFVDDDRIILSKIQRLVSDEPFRSLFASSGSQAIDIMESEPVDVVVTDLVMPEMDGLVLLDWVQAEYPDTIRMVVSSLNDTDAILESINSGSVYRYLIKPWKPGDLKVAVRQAVDMFNIQRDRAVLAGKLDEATQSLQQCLSGGADHLLEMYYQAEIEKYAAHVVDRLRGPLQNIRGAVRRAETECEPQLSDGQPASDAFEGIRQSVNDMIRLAGRILEESRDRSLFSRGAVDVNAMVKSLVPEAIRAADIGDRITRHLQLEDDLPLIDGTPLQVQQVIGNLIDNALCAMADMDAPTLTIETRLADDAVEIVIADNGVGMSAEAIEKVFQPGFSQQMSGAGTGLGLAAVKAMVDAYGGDLRMTSAPGRGTSVTLQLPVGVIDPDELSGDEDFELV